MNKIWADIKERFQKGDILTRLIYVNAGVFVLSIIFGILWGLFTGSGFSNSSWIFASWTALPTNDITGFIFKPYTLVTHMFVHVDIFHMLFNMLLLYFIGKLFLNYFGSKQLFGLYILGGLIGAFTLLVATNLSPFFKAEGLAYGASAAVMAIAIGIIAYTPNTKVNLFGMFPVKLMWIGAFYVISDLISFYDSNTGGHLAHLAGAATGYWFAAAFKQGKDITTGINEIMDIAFNFFKPKAKMKVVYNQQKVRKMSDEEYNSTQKATQAEIDIILDKISASGYSALTQREKDILFQYSNKK